MHYAPRDLVWKRGSGNAGDALPAILHSGHVPGRPCLPGALFCHLPVIFLAFTDLVAMPPQETGTVAKAAGACNGQAGRHAPALR
ncbi:hypothetical protein CBM2634_B120064 [Cupriavidus taiwanensis]|uniref:Uncharacterized protein n=1 Tax=Cupriavidus taiwanensis TaxID=164546 RepID=A0A375J3U7_9BURK|nr:hypothetical protein CBM2634_B120064 [Cupriavidus taiwanensis]